MIVSYAPYGLNGWIAPDGTYYDVGKYVNDPHTLFLEIHLQTSEEDKAFALGWIKVDSKPIDMTRNYIQTQYNKIFFSRKQPTQAQINTLFDLGFTNFEGENIPI